MCGICGEFNFVGKPVSHFDIEAMAASLIHRGPDDSGIYCDAIIGLGHRRLSIIDLSSNGKQPIWDNEKSLCLVFNGEIYNYKEIQEELKFCGYHFLSSSDSEVVVNAVHCWGLDKALSKFIGMFAFAIWNSKEKTLYLARDRAGIKPLYYYLSEDMLLFGSEIRAILSHKSFKRTLNNSSLRQYFVFGHFPGESTVFNNTFKLQPGHYMEINAGGKVIEKEYWSIKNLNRGSFRGSFQDASEELETLFKSAFKYRLVADVPVGLFLSGGIDSSLVSSILKKENNADILNITIGFNEDNYNEAPKAEQVAKELGVDHVVHYMDANQAQETLLKFCDIYDEPFADTSGIPTYIMSKLARDHVKVALSADGGDEQFCGYDHYVSYLKTYQFMDRFPYALRHILSSVLGKMGPCLNMFSKLGSSGNQLLHKPQFFARFEKIVEALKLRTTGDVIALMHSMAWTVNNIGGLKSKDILNQLSYDDFSYVKDGNGDLLDSMMRTGFSSPLPNDILTKVDRASMAVSLECRDPMLDHRITEFAFSLPMEYLCKDGEQKLILKSILKKWVSESIINSPKRGFTIPLYYWLKGPWKPIVKDFLTKRRVNSIGYLNGDIVEKEVNLFYKYEGRRAEKIWTLLNFQMWAEKWYKL